MNRTGIVSARELNALVREAPRPNASRKYRETASATPDRLNSATILAYSSSLKAAVPLILPPVSHHQRMYPSASLNVSAAAAGS